MSAKPENLSPEQRGQIKGNKLEYLYQIPESYAHLPLLGSAVRALGKEWSVEVDFEGKQDVVFQRLKDLLKEPERLRINAGDNESDLLLIGGKQAELINRRRDSIHTLGRRHVMTSGQDIDENYDLVSGFNISTLNEQGVIAITGAGKGKTTTAIGFAAETMTSGRKTAIVQWFKERKSGRMTWSINEHFFPQMLKSPELMRFEPMGLGFFGSPTMDRVAEYKAHKAKACEGLELAKELIHSGDYGLVVLDEFVDTVPEISANIEVPLIDLEEVQFFLDEVNQQNQTQVVVTGRQVTDDWRQYVGHSIVIDEIRHPWSTRQAGAVSGLDF